METLTIVLADDHRMFRHGIRRILEENDHIKIIGEADDGLELINILKKNTPNLVILDISMPNIRGIEAIKAIKLINSSIKILMLSMHRNMEYVKSALTSGADGYLLKEDADTELLESIAIIRQGKTYLSPLLVKQLSMEVAHDLRSIDRTESDPLTTREREILKMAGEGKTNKEISDALFISIRTVHHHRESIMQKLNLKNVADLVRYAIEKDYVTLFRPLKK